MALMRTRRAKPANTVIVGAGVAGRLVLQEIRKRRELNYVVRGFVDDDPSLQGKEVEGVPVLGTTADLPSLRDAHGLEEAIIAMPSVPGASVRKIVDRCRRAGLATQIVPGAVDVLTGRANVSAARPVNVEDLLRRPTVVMSEEVKDHFAGKTVLVTGAAGSIGSELCRNLCVLGVRRLVAFDTDENGTFELSLELGSLPAVVGGATAVDAIVGSVTNAAKVDWLFRTFRPDVVFHAAARKHVPLMEAHPEEAVEANVHGTELVAEACAAHGVETLVHISTDKAVDPTSVMGATKRLSEMLVGAVARANPATRCVTVRFGNVIGSRGSVLEVFRHQLAAGGPITVTDPEMTRYFMTANEAAVLLLQSVVIGETGDVLVLDMGEPVRIADLARDFITLSGYGSEDDVEIKVTGARPGEKRHERLQTEGERLEATKHPRILRVAGGAGAPVRGEDVAQLIERAHAMDRASLTAALRTLVPNYRPGEGVTE